MKPEVKINFTGGEPLTSPLTIPVAEYAKKLGIKCTLMTNGTLIFEAMANASGNIRLYEFLQEIGEHYATKKKLCSSAASEKGKSAFRTTATFILALFSTIRNSKQ